MRESVRGGSRVPDDGRRVRAEVLQRYARLSKKGRPRICSPRAVELSGVLRENKGSNGKIIYPDLATAQAAAAELDAAGFGAHRAYPCERSRHGHFHLTTDTRRPAVDAVHGRCPVCGHLVVLEGGTVVAHTKGTGDARLCRGSRQPAAADRPVPVQRDAPVTGAAVVVDPPATDEPATSPDGAARRRASRVVAGLLIAAAALLVLSVLYWRG